MTCGVQVQQDREYTEFRVSAQFAFYDSSSPSQRERFRGLSRDSRDKQVGEARERLNTAVTRDYWALLPALVQSYYSLRSEAEHCSFRDDSAENASAIPDVLPTSLPKGTPVLFGEYHGRELPVDAELHEWKSTYPGYEGELVRGYVLGNGGGNWVSVDYIDWRKVKR